MLALALPAERLQPRPDPCIRGRVGTLGEGLPQQPGQLFQAVNVYLLLLGDRFQNPRSSNILQCSIFFSTIPPRSGTQGTL